MAAETGAGAMRRSIRDVTCLGCGCLCDDMVVRIEAERVVDVEPQCALARAWFQAERRTSTSPIAAIDGRPAEIEAAVERIVAILSEARAPVVYGLTTATTETVREALRLADFIGAKVVLNRTLNDLGRVAAFQEHGRVTATLGEVKNRADLVVFWRSDPVRTHPRHFERYSVHPVGRFVGNGRAGRTLIVVDGKRTETAGAADMFVTVPDGQDCEALALLRMALRGKTIEPRSNPYRDERDVGMLANLAERMKRARYGVLFFQAADDARTGSDSSAQWEAASKLVRVLNDFTRFVLLGMGTKGNLSGAEAALTWQTGFLQGVDFRMGYPEPIDTRVTLDDVLSHGEADALLSVADELPAGLSRAALAHLATIPDVRIGPPEREERTSTPTVALMTATCGIDAGGTVVRSDGVTLPLRPPLASPFPSDREWLQRVIEGLTNRAALKA